MRDSRLQDLGTRFMVKREFCGTDSRQGPWVVVRPDPLTSFTEDRWVHARLESEFVQDGPNRSTAIYKVDEIAQILPSGAVPFDPDREEAINVLLGIADVLDTIPLIARAQWLRSYVETLK